MNVAERRERVRRWLAGDTCVYAPNLYDPLSARVAEDVGFEVGVFSAHGAEWMINGGAELCKVTISELAEQSRRIVRSCDLSILVTGPFGFGNALNEIRYVQDLEGAGASVVTIGDQKLPLTFPSISELDPYGNDLDFQPMVPVEEAVGKIKAALAARQDPRLVIAARTAGFTLDDIPGAVRRVTAYAKAGAEAVWLTRASTKGIEALRKACDLPLIVGDNLWRAGEWKGRPFRDPAIARFLTANNVRIASLGNTPIRAVAKAYHDAFIAMREGRHDDVERISIGKEQFERITRLSQDNEWIRSFLN